MASYQLDAHPDYWRLSEEERKERCNGCGAKRGLPIPDTIWGLNITEACDIHDDDYVRGTTEQHKQEADQRLLYNGMQLIEAQTGWYQCILKPLRRRRMLKYYEAVVAFGDKAFWHGKDHQTQGGESD